MPGVWDDDQFFGFGRAFVGVLAELAGVGLAPAMNSMGRGEIVSMSLKG